MGSLACRRKSKSVIGSIQHDTSIEVAPSGGSSFVIATLDDVRLECNFRGVRATHGSVVVVTRNIASGSVSSGFAIQATSSAVNPTLDSSMSACNCGTGVHSGGAMASARVTRSTIADNAVQGLQSPGGAIASFGNNQVADDAGDNGAAMPTVPQI
jgi:hypothetical protein